MTSTPQTRLFLGASFLKSLLAQDAAQLAEMREAFSPEELLEALIPQAAALGRRYAAARDISPQELGERILAVAHLAKSIGHPSVG